MSLQTMYPGMNNSPKTALASSITASATSITLNDSSVLPQAPNIAVIGSNVQAEVIIYSEKNGNTLVNVIRGAGGTTARGWEEGTSVARNFTLLDYNNICNNITELNTVKRDKSTAVNMATEVTGVLGVANGGTGNSSLSDVKTWLGLAALAFKSIIDLASSDVTGTLPVGKGGTGLTASPSMQTNLTSTSAANVMAAAPRPGVTGVLGAGNGGTGAATASPNNVLAGPSSGSSAAAPSFRALAAADIPSLDTSKLGSGTLGVGRGGTGAATASANRVFAGPSTGSAAAPSFRALAAADIPSLDAGKITSGTLGTDRIPALAASKITSGTFDAARIPSLAGTKIVYTVNTSAPSGSLTKGTLYFVV